MKEKTLAIIKPDGVERHLIGEIISRYERNGLNIIGLKMVRLSKPAAAQFYAVHAQRPFFAELVEFMSSGPIVVMVLEGAAAIQKNRQLMGATNPSEAEAGTIRKDFAQSTGKNIVHGSDSPESAEQEIAFFFEKEALFS